MSDLRLIRDLIKELKGNVSVSPYTEEELIPSYKDDETQDQKRVYYLTGESSATKELVGNTTASEFAFFQDGSQRTLQVGTIQVRFGETIRIIPVMYFTVATVILKRTNKNLSVFSTAMSRSGLLLEKKLITDAEIVAKLENSRIHIEDTSSIQTLDGSDDYYALKRKSLIKAKSLRLEIEEQLLEKWVNENPGDSFILIDGTIMNFRKEPVLKRCVGISHSYRLNFPDFDKILRLGELERSGIFSFHKDQSEDLQQSVRERLSWFMRLRSSPIQDPEFGLIRAEIHYTHKDNGPIDLIKRLSSSLALEKLPTSYPDSSWHKMLYPIRECSTYLSSILPSAKSIQAQLRL